MIAVAIAGIITGLLIWALCRPLIKREIPMNQSYGFRIRAAFESDQRWYEINEYGGRKLTTWSWLITAWGVTGLLIPKSMASTYAIVAVLVSVAAVLIPIVQTRLWSRRTRA